MADGFKFENPLAPDMIAKINTSIQPQRVLAESITKELCSRNNCSHPNTVLYLNNYKRKEVITYAQNQR